MSRWRDRTAAFLHSLHSILDQVHLHVQAVNLVEPVRQPLHLPSQNIHIACIVPSRLSGRRSGTHFSADLIEGIGNTADVLVQPGDGALDFGELATMGLEHSGVIGYLRLQAGDGTGPDIVGDSIGAIGRHRRMSRMVYGSMDWWC